MPKFDPRYFNLSNYFKNIENLLFFLNYHKLIKYHNRLIFYQDFFAIKIFRYLMNALFDFFFLEIERIL